MDFKQAIAAIERMDAFDSYYADVEQAATLQQIKRALEELERGGPEQVVAWMRQAYQIDQYEKYAADERPFCTNYAVSLAAERAEQGYVEYPADDEVDEPFWREQGQP